MRAFEVLGVAWGCLALVAGCDHDPERFKFQGAAAAGDSHDVDGGSPEAGGMLPSRLPDRCVLPEAGVPAIARFDPYRVARGRTPYVGDRLVIANDENVPSVREARMTTERGGSVELASSGQFEYEPPAPDFWGDDYFSYEVTSDDGCPLTQALVRVTVNPDLAAISLAALAPAPEGSSVVPSNG